MGPVKDVDLLKSVKENNRSKFLKQLTPEKNFSVSKFSVKEDRRVPGGRIRLKLTHVNVDCHEEKTGYTPLIIAVLNGNKDIAEDLLFHSANPNSQDNKGNTALHMAVFGSQIELVEMLLQNKAEVNIQNSDGNTPLHIACQSADSDCRVHIMLKLIQSCADVELANRDGNIALDVAAMFNKTEAVSVLLDNDHSRQDSSSKTRTNTSALIEGAIRGNKDVVELLLDYGYDPNILDKTRNTAALIEAVRFVRLPVAESLLKYGAKSDKTNSKGESAESLLSSLPKPMADKFSALFETYKQSGATQTPRFLKVLTRGASLQAMKGWASTKGNKPET